MEWDDSFFFLHHRRGVHGHLRDAAAAAYLPCDHDGWILAAVLFGVLLFLFLSGRGFESMFAEKRSEIVLEDREQHRRGRRKCCRALRRAAGGHGGSE